MGKIFTQTINRFDGGLSEDKRVQDSSKFSLTKHFDVFTYPHKLVPYVKTEISPPGGTDLTRCKIVKFLYAPFTSGYRLFGYGIDYINGTNRPKVFTYDIDAGTPDVTNWGEPANGECTVNNRNTEVFFYYKDYIYMWSGGTVLVRHNATGNTAFNNAYQSINYTNVAQPVHHPADDNAYFFADNIVYKQTDNATGWSTVLTLPTSLKITCACAYGNYLAIGCATLGTSEVQSLVFLWDRDSSLTTVSDKLDFGSGALVHLANLDNKLIGIVNGYLNLTYGLGKGKLFIRQANGNFAATLNEIMTDTTISAAGFPSTRVVKDNILYFPLHAPLNGDTRLGIWAVNGSGRATLALVQEGATSYEGIYVMANIWWIAHSNDGTVSRTDDNAVYSSTLSSVYESLILNGGDSSKKKKLTFVNVTTEKLPAAGTVVLKYRIDGATSWTTIFTNSTDDSMSHTAVNIESSGAELPEYREIELQVNSAGGAVITGIKLGWETIDDDIIQ